MLYLMLFKVAILDALWITSNFETNCKYLLTVGINRVGSAGIIYSATGLFVSSFKNIFLDLFLNLVTQKSTTVRCDYEV